MASCHATGGMSVSTQFVRSFVCSFAIQAKTMHRAPLNSLTKVGLQKCPTRVEIARLAVLEEI